MIEDSPQKKQVEHGLSDNEEVYRYSQVGIAQHDPDNRLLMINPRYCEILGRSEQELDGVSPARFAHPDDAGRQALLLEDGFRTGKPVQLEQRYVRPDGSAIWCAINISFVRDDAGDIVSSITVVEDITACRLAEDRRQQARNLLQEVIDSVDDLIFAKDREGRYVMANRNFGGASVLGRTDMELFAPEVAESYMRADREVLETGMTYRLEEQAFPAKGRPGQYQTVKFPWRRHGEIVGVIGISRDIGDRLGAEKALGESNRKLATFIDNLPGVVYSADPLPPWPHSFISEGVKDLTGYDAEEFCNGKLNWADLVHPDDLNRISQTVAEAGREQRPYIEEYRIIRRSGEVRWVLDRGQFIRGPSGRAASLEGVAIDITRRKRAEERVRWVAWHDALTGLPNRVLFNKRLKDGLEHASRTGRPLGLLLIDADYLKQINDTLGHDGGDALLRELGGRLARSVRETDTVSRHGGDEFAVLLPDIDGISDMNAAIDRIISSLEVPFLFEGHELYCRISIGASIWRDPPESGADLLMQADMALQAAKAAGRGQAMLFEPKMRAETERKAVMFSQASWALQERRIEPFYQAKIVLDEGRVAGFEALLRWRTASGDIETPASLEAAFSEPRLIIDMGRQIRETVISDMRRWLDAGVEFGHVAINVSEAEFRSQGFVNELLECLRNAGIPTRYLQVEVTETVFLGRGAECVEQGLRRLSKEGIKIALDDFGTGYASLLHLKQFPVDIIKIDQSFVRDLVKSSEDTAILSSVLSLGRSLGLATVAEGVETAAQAGFLREHGCDFGQGYLFARPRPRNTVPEFLSSWDAGHYWTLL